MNGSFVIVLLLLLLGVVQFGLAFNYWQDLSHLANEGMRWAAVDRIPGNDNPSAAQVEAYIEGQIQTQGLRDAVQGPGGGVNLCVVNTPPVNPVGQIGQAATIRINAPYKFPLLFGLADINLSGSSTMRLEQSVINKGWIACP